MKLFALGATRAYGERVAERLNMPLAAHEEREFKDGEFKIRPLEEVGRESVFVCHSLAADAAQSANDKLCRLLFFGGALKDAGAAEVTAVVPYLAYSRKDRRTQPRDPVTTRYVARLVEAAGFSGVVALDVHNAAAFDNAFNCRKEHLAAVEPFTAHFARLAAAEKKVVVLSPDVGGVARARNFAEALSAALVRPVELAFAEKRRRAGRVAGDLLAGNVRDALVIVFDDLISAGTTMVRAAAACAKRGSRSVHAAATHGVFAQDAAQTLSSSVLSSIVVTDTVDDVRQRAAGLRIPLHVVETASLVATAIERWPA